MFGDGEASLGGTKGVCVLAWYAPSTHPTNLGTETAKICYAQRNDVPIVFVLQHHFSTKHIVVKSYITL